MQRISQLIETTADEYQRVISSNPQLKQRRFLDGDWPTVIYYDAGHNIMARKKRRQYWIHQRYARAAA
jgi:hypothetical protein